MRAEVIAENGSHKWVVLGRDPDKREDVIDTNEYAIVTPGGTMLLDPGGVEIFPQVLSAVTQYVGTDKITSLFASHQDPDIISSLPMWLELCPQAKTYVSWMWRGFIAHFIMNQNTEMVSLPDEGGMIPIYDDGPKVTVVPAHYCHSSGNYSIYDPAVRVLFSGDIGAALLPDHTASLFVEDFDEHIRYMETFHLRWMPSNTALRAWTKRVRALEPTMICPQHGSIFRNGDVPKLLDWLDSLDVGKIPA